MPRGGFFLSYLRHPRATGSITPSSRFLVRKLLEPLDASSFKYVVELGAGDGRVTTALLRKFGNNCCVLAFEINERLAKSIEQTDNLRLVHDDGEHLARYLARYHLRNVDYVVSSLPLANFAKAKRQKLLDVVHHALKEEGKFVQYQYTLFSLKDLRLVFRKVSISFTPFNIPPAFVYTCEK